MLIGECKGQQSIVKYPPLPHTSHFPHNHGAGVCRGLPHPVVADFQANVVTVVSPKN